MIEDVDEPIGQRLRVMTVLHVAPGRARDPNHGTPIGILSVTYDDEIEQPIMFALDDVRRLAKGCLAVLAHFEDAVAVEIVTTYYPEICSEG